VNGEVVIQKLGILSHIPGFYEGDL
jgi:hypothetical protein